MTLTTETLANYLGRPASAVLAEAPFRNWIFEKLFENDLEEPLIDYVFVDNGVDLVCDGDEKVVTIFLYSDESRCFKEGLKDLPFVSTRQEVIDRLGTPIKSGGKMRDSILGEYGAWDRFIWHGHSIHIEYQGDGDFIKKVTFMRADIVP